MNLATKHFRPFSRIARRRSGCRGAAGFTMVEIALSLGIIAFALVAIIGVLPAGLKVQKENREETIINQDGMYFLEAIRSGAKGLDDLTNFVESITVTYGRTPVTFTNTTANVANRLVDGRQIVGLLTTPKLERLPNGTFRTNLVEARVRAISGVASEKSRLNNELSFRYVLRSEITPFANRPLTEGTVTAHGLSITTNLFNNLYDVRLTIRWPLFEKGTEWDTGRGRKSFRTQVAGELRTLRAPNGPISLYWFEPRSFATNFYTTLF